MVADDRGKGDGVMPESLRAVECQAKLVAVLRELCETQEAVLRQAALDAHAHGHKIAAVSRAAQVSRPTFYTWLEPQNGQPAR